jgi:large subunit ribosomal protein L32e
MCLVLRLLLFRVLICARPGFHKFRVQNVKDLELLLMHNRTYAAEIGSTVSTRKRQEIVKRAAELNVKVTNASARVRTTESA